MAFNPSSGSPGAPQSRPRPFGSGGNSSNTGTKERFPNQNRDRDNRGGRDRYDGIDNRLNHQIRVPKVRLIDEKGQQVGIVDTRDALKMAQDRKLDLMEVAPEAKPPVCKLIDYGKFKYEKKKEEHAAKKKQVVIKIKEIQLRPNTDQHDLDYKMKNAKTFLEEGDKVKVTMIFRGRQMAYTEQGYEMMNGIIKIMDDYAVLESAPKLEGKKMFAIFAPKPKKAGSSTKPVSTAPKTEPAKPTHNGITIPVKEPAKG